MRLHEAADPSVVARFGPAALEGYVEVPNDGKAGHEVCVQQWIKLLRGEPADIRTSGRTCRGTVEVAEAAYRSETERREIALPITPYPWVELVP